MEACGKVDVLELHTGEIAEKLLAEIADTAAYFLKLPPHPSKTGVLYKSFCLDFAYKGEENPHKEGINHDNARVTKHHSEIECGRCHIWTGHIDG